VELHCQIIESPYHLLVSRAIAYKLSDCIQLQQFWHHLQNVRLPAVAVCKLANLCPPAVACS